MKKVKFIYNPSSGESQVATRVDEIAEIYQSKGYAISLYRLNFCENQTQQILSDLDASYHHVLIAGGDGTVNYVVNVMKKAGLDIPIAVLPTGTANDFASIFGVPSDIRKACKSLLDGEINSIDLGLVNGEYFVNVFSSGLMTEVSQKTPTIFKNTFGKLAYYVSGLAELPKFRKMNLKIESDAGGYEGSSVLFMVFNGKTAGNITLAPLSVVDDGLLDVLIIKGDNPMETLSAAFRYFAQVRKTKYPAGVVHLQCSWLKVESAEFEATDMDGQAGPEFPLSMTCESGALRVLCPVVKVRIRKITQ